MRTLQYLLWQRAVSCFKRSRPTDMFSAKGCGSRHAGSASVGTRIITCLEATKRPQTQQPCGPVSLSYFFKEPILRLVSVWLPLKATTQRLRTLWDFGQDGSPDHSLSLEERRQEAGARMGKGKFLIGRPVGICWILTSHLLKHMVLFSSWF